MTLQKNLPNQPHEVVDPLTERELEILRLLAEGWTDRKIAQHLVLSINTVKWYNKQLYSKLFVKNRTQAVKYAREHGLLEATPSPARPADAIPPRHNLPAATIPFIGRELELNELSALLTHADIRLVTILAAGGMGKTRLALEAAKAQLPKFPNGVYFIPLAQLRAVDNIIPTIAAHLNVQLATASDPTEQLLNHLRDKTMLLVLDNFEHLLAGASLITLLLEAAPGLKVLVTSRERLNLRGETGYALGGMALPTGETRAETLTSSAVQLFIQRIQMMRANAAVPDDDLASVQRICRQVGGMPLGIELAASLVDVLSPQEISAEIEQNFDILATEMRDMPPRLRSIRAVFDYSWSRLAEAERKVYRRLAVFRAGFTREAAQAVAGANFRVLKALVNKSLVQRQAENDRYVIHELLRQYAEEKLQACGTATATHQAHATYYMGLVAQAECRIKGQGQLEALNQIELDFENIRAAWEWAVDHADFEAINQSLEALYWFCNMRARVPTGEQLFQQAREQFGLSFDPEAHPVQRRLLLRFDASGDDYKTQIEQVLALARQHSHQSEVAFFLWMLGYNRFFSSDFKQAIPILEEAIALFQTLGEDFYRAESLHWLGVCHRFLGQVEEARAYARQIRELSRRTGNKFALARILGSRAIYEVLEGNNAQARSDLQEAIAIRDELGYQAGVAISLVGLGLDAFFQGDFSRAKIFVEDSLTRATDSNSLFPKAMALSMLGWLAALEETYNEAWRLCQESQSISPNPNVPMIAQLGLAMAACGLENYATARELLETWLKSGSPLHTLKGLLSCLPVLAILYANQDEAERAVEVLALALTHPKSPTGWIAQWPLLKRWQTELETGLNPERYAAAWERGTQLEIEAVISEFSPLKQFLQQPPRASRHLPTQN
jgi:predicted ATPase/DNA-binding CsgD family transcriptional regulator